MSTATYSDIGGPDGHLANRRPFEGNSMRAWYESDGTYSVYSYRTRIAGVGLEVPWVAAEKYSVTTSRHQNLCRVWL